MHVYMFFYSHMFMPTDRLNLISKLSKQIKVCIASRRVLTNGHGWKDTFDPNIKTCTSRRALDKNKTMYDNWQFQSSIWKQHWRRWWLGVNKTYHIKDELTNAYMSTNRMIIKWNYKFGRNSILHVNMYVDVTIISQGTDKSGCKYDTPTQLQVDIMTDTG